MLFIEYIKYLSGTLLFFHTFHIKDYKTRTHRSESDTNFNITTKTTFDIIQMPISILKNFIYTRIECAFYVNLSTKKFHQIKRHIRKRTKYFMEKKNRFLFLIYDIK